ncbi:O-antigen ligase [Salinibacter ruber]|nr:O-antigen ligase family protein [Salinibacter ruber]MCS3857802.1 O-antigen ligase [Salinibacter ruber]
MPLAKGAFFISTIVYWVKHEGDLKNFLLVLVFISIVVIVSSYVQSLTPYLSFLWPNQAFSSARLEALNIELDINRSTGIIMGYGLFGSYTLPASIVFLSYVFAGNLSRAKNVLFTAAYIFLTIAVLLVSQSRSTLLAAITGSITVFVLWIPRSNMSVILKYAISTAITVAMLVLFSDMAEVIVNLHEKSVSSRLRQFILAIEAVPDYMLGTGAYRASERIGFGGLIHNTYLSVLLKGGILSFICYLYYHYMSIKYIFSKAKTIPDEIYLALYGILAINITEMMLYEGISNLIHYNAVGLCISMWTIRPRK